MNFDVVWHAVQGVLSLFILGSVGFLVSKVGWVNTEAKILLNKLVLFVSLPPYMLYNITNFMSKDTLLNLSYGLLVPAVSIGLTFAVGMLLSKILKISRERHGGFCCGFALSNTIFIGLPVNLALFGELAVPYVLLYYFANTTFSWTLGHYLIAASGSLQTVNGKIYKPKFFSRTTIKHIFSPPMLGLLLGLALLLLGLPLPGFVKDSARYLGFLTTPLALIIIGVNLQKTDISKIRLSRDLAVVLLGRFVLSPLLVVALCRFVPLPELMRKVFIIQASLPVMMNLALLCSFYKSDEAFGTLTVSVSTLLSIVTIPILMFLVNGTGLL
jgi:predicted permease